MLGHLGRDALNGRVVDSLAIEISALAISGGNSSSERIKLDRDLFAEVFGSGRKRVLVGCSVVLKKVAESMESSPLEDW